MPTGAVHFHVRWSDSTLDWKAFETSEEARTHAEELVLSGETYVIEEFDPTFPRCRGEQGYRRLPNVK